jgi:hypothetical protein
LGAPAIAIRPAVPGDAEAIWQILEPVIRAGETYPLPRDMSRHQALAYWQAREHAVFVAEDDGAIVGTYYLRANAKAGGAHVANCGYMTRRKRAAAASRARCACTRSPRPRRAASAPCNSIW